MCLYPLEVFETLLQGEAANGSETGSIIARTSKPKRVWSANKFHYEKTIGAIETDPLYLQAVAPSSLQIAQTAWARGALLHGADMALLSALFGFTAFFSALELTAPLGNSVWILFARNLFACLDVILIQYPVSTSQDNNRSIRWCSGNQTSSLDHIQFHPYRSLMEWNARQQPRSYI
eukprot:IDg12411t1